MTIEYKMYLKILQKVAAWWRFKTGQALRSAVMKIPCILNSSKNNFIKKSPPLSTWRKLSILLKFPLPSVCFSGVFLTLKCETLVLFTIAIELSYFCLTLEDFCLGLTFSHGPRDPNLVPRALFPGFRGGAGKGPAIGRSYDQQTPTICRCNKLAYDRIR